MKEKNKQRSQKQSKKKRKEKKKSMGRFPKKSKESVGSSSSSTPYSRPEIEFRSNMKFPFDEDTLECFKQRKLIPFLKHEENEFKAVPSRFHQFGDTRFFECYVPMSNVTTWEEIDRLVDHENMKCFGFNLKDYEEQRLWEISELFIYGIYKAVGFFAVCEKQRGNLYVFLQSDSGYNELIERWSLMEDTPLIDRCLRGLHLEVENNVKHVLSTQFSPREFVHEDYVPIDDEESDDDDQHDREEFCELYEKTRTKSLKKAYVELGMSDDIEKHEQLGRFETESMMQTKSDYNDFAPSAIIRDLDSSIYKISVPEKVKLLCQFTPIDINPQEVSSQVEDCRFPLKSLEVNFSDYCNESKVCCLIEFKIDQTMAEFMNDHKIFLVTPEWVRIFEFKVNSVTFILIGFVFNYPYEALLRVANRGLYGILSTFQENQTLLPLKKMEIKK